MGGGRNVRKGSRTGKRKSGEEGGVSDSYRRVDVGKRRKKREIVKEEEAEEKEDREEGVSDSYRRVDVGKRGKKREIVNRAFEIGRKDSEEKKKRKKTLSKEAIVKARRCKRKDKEGTMDGIARDIRMKEKRRIVK